MKCTRVVAAAVIALTVCGAVAWVCLGAWAYDDWYYRLTLLEGVTSSTVEWLGVDPEITTFDQAWTSALNHRTLNGRLPNYLHILMQPLGHDVEAVLMGLCVAAFFVMLCVAGYRRSGRLTPLGAALCAVVLWLFFPWVEGFESLVYIFNYVPASLLFIGAILMLGRPRTRGLWTLALLSFFTAWMNEGCGVALVAWTVGMLCFDGRRRPVLTALGAAVAGLLINLAIGTSDRIAETSVGWHLDRPVMFRMMQALWPVYIALGLCLIAYLCGKDKASRREVVRRYLPAVAGMVSAIGMAIVLQREERVLWPAFLCAALIVVGLLSPRLGGIPVRVQNVLGIVFVLVYGWWLATLCVWQQRVGDETRMAEAAFGARNSGGASVLYGSHIADDDIPYYLFRIVHNPLDMVWSNYTMSLFLSSDTAVAMVMPRELEGKTFEEWPEVPGSAGMKGVWPMIATRDSRRANYNLVAAEPTSNMAPLDHMLLAARGYRLGSLDTVTVNPDVFRATMADSTVIYRYVMPHLPRTFRRRHIAAVDTVAEI